jgi:hypothetical protein
MSLRKFSLAGILAALVLGVAAGVSAAGDQPTPIARGPHISGVVRYQPGGAAGAAAATTTTCSTPGSGNYKPNCHGQGRPVNETWMTRSGSLYVAGANDYNSYNGQGQNGFYWSTNGTSWNDAGPLDVFPHNTNNGAGDPGLALNGTTAYYSSLFFNFHNCGVGGVELTVGHFNSTTNSWSWGTPVQFAADSRSAFQDKPAIALDATHGKVFESWTQFGSCTGVNVTSPIRVAVANASTPSSYTILSNVPGSTYSQGSSIAADGAGGFWLAWEEFPNASAGGIGIRLAHWNGTAWASLDSSGHKFVTVSPSTFEDLANPLSGFSFRDNSFPALTLTSGIPAVTWTAFDTSQATKTQKGRDYVFFAGSATTPLTSSKLVRLANFFPTANVGHQFFPAIAPDGAGGVWVSFSQENLNASGNSLGSYNQYKADVTKASTSGSVGETKVSTAASVPSNDAFFSGQFIGDYNGLATDAGNGAHPIWTDIRGPDPFYNSWEMDAMTAFP